MAKGNGNGQGNFTKKGRRTGPMSKLMKKEAEEEKRRKRIMLINKILFYREKRKPVVKKILRGV